MCRGVQEGALVSVKRCRLEWLESALTPQCYSLQTVPLDMEVICGPKVPYQSGPVYPIVMCRYGSGLRCGGELIWCVFLVVLQCGRLECGIHVG